MTCVDRPGPKGGQHVPAIEIDHRHLRAWRSGRARQAVGDFVPVRHETNKLAWLGTTGSTGAACGAFEAERLAEAPTSGWHPAHAAIRCRQVPEAGVY